MNRRLTLWIVWLALLMAIGMYGFVGFQTVDPEAADHSGDQATMERVLTIAAVAQFAFSFVIRGLFISLPGLVANGNFKHSFAGQIIIWAMIDAIPLYGLVLFFTGSEADLFMKFLIAGGVGMIIHAPIWTILRGR